jgi:tRNA pseudouridine38-40 synthase
MSQAQTFKLTISYDGTRYYGWQKQLAVPTIQRKLERALEKLFGQKIKTAGASRTDRGVHACGQVVSFDATDRFEPQALQSKLNAILPDDIAVVSAETVDPLFNARFDSRGKTYLYRILLSKNPMKSRFGWYPYKNLADKLIILNEIAALFIGVHNFSAFSIKKELPDDPTCDIRRAFWKIDDDELVLTIAGDRFLQRMIRLIVGASYDCAFNRFEPAIITQMLDSGSRRLEYKCAPAHGLTLKEVYYENKNILI